MVGQRSIPVPQCIVYPDAQGAHCRNSSACQTNMPCTDAWLTSDVIAANLQAVVTQAIKLCIVLQALMPVAVFVVGCAFGTEKYSSGTFANMLIVSLGVAIASYGRRLSKAGLTLLPAATLIDMLMLYILIPTPSSITAI